MSARYNRDTATQRLRLAGGKPLVQANTLIAEAAVYALLDLADALHDYNRKAPTGARHADEAER